MKKTNRYAYVIITLFFCIVVLIILLIVIISTSGNSSVSLLSANTSDSLPIPVTYAPEYPKANIMGSLISPNVDLQVGSVSPSPIPTDASSSSAPSDAQFSSTLINGQSSSDINIANSDNEDEFYKSIITDDIYRRIANVSYPDNCSVSLSDLNYIHVLHYGFDKKIHEGELIVACTIADDILDIFMELFDAKYPIEHIKLIDEYGADDESSMQHNNTSAFNYRVIAGTDVLSNHALGLAIDINPLYNPYVHGSFVQPHTAEKYADRDTDCSYYIRENDVCYNAFISRDFTWGGNWLTKKDYQHFEKTLK